MKIYDISRPLNQDTAVYKNIPGKRFHLTAIARHNPDGYHESEMKSNLHTGTHADAPLHMLPDGAPLKAVPLDHFIGPCRVLDLTQVKAAVHEADLVPFAPQPGEILLLKTSNSYDSGFNPEFVYVEEDAAHYLVSCGVKTIGIDAMSVERGKKGHETHHILLGRGVSIIEDVRLADVPGGSYFASLLPLSIPEAEAAPMRAVLLDFNTDRMEIES